MAQTIDGRVRELIEAPNFAYIATLRKDGTPLVVPVWIDLEDDTLVVNSAQGRAWPANLERDGRVTITVPDKDNPYEYVAIRGRLAETTTDGADDHADKMAKKYMGVDTYPFRQPGEVRIRVAIEPEELKHHAAG